MKLPRLKFCGFTRQEDVAQALELQIDAIGLNFYPKSKRYIEPQAARKLSLIAQGACLRVGIFVDATPEQIDQVLSVCPLDAIQLHGSETIDWLGQYQQSSYWPSLPILKALAYRGAIDDPSLGSMGRRILHSRLTADRYARGCLRSTGEGWNRQASQLGVAKSATQMHAWP